MESEGGKYDSEIYELNYFINEDSSEEAVDFAIIDVAIEDGKVTDITDSGFTADLSVISD